MAETEYIKKIKDYYQSDDFNKNFVGKWVAKVIDKPNFDLPQFASKKSPSDNISSTSYVYEALIFESKESAEKFIKDRKRTDFEAYCFRLGGIN